MLKVKSNFCVKLPQPKNSCPNESYMWKYDVAPTALIRRRRLAAAMDSGLADNPFMSVAYHELVPAIQKALSTLPPRWQQVLLLRFEDGLSSAKVGDIIGVTGARVDQIERQVLKKLRQPRIRLALKPHMYG